MPFKSPESNRARTKCYGCLVGEDRQIIDYDAVVALEGRHGFAGAKCRQSSVDMSKSRASRARWGGAAKREGEEKIMKDEL